MSRLYRSLLVWLHWLSFEWLAACACTFFGLHVAVALYVQRHFGLPRHSAFATILPADGAGDLTTVLFIVMPLLVGAGCQACGLRRARGALVQMGTLLEFFVFLAALVSCCAGNRWGTGVPAYVFLSAFTARLFLSRSFRFLP